MADNAQQQEQTSNTTDPVEIAKELNVKDFDAANDRDKMYMGIITKLRGKNRELNNSFTSLQTKYTELEGEVTTFRRTTKESEIINSVLGDTKQIGDMDKFTKWKAKLASGDSWEDDLKELVADFAVEKTTDSSASKKDEKKSETKVTDKKADEKKAEQKAPEKKTEEKKDDDDKKPEERRPAYTPRFMRGNNGGRTEEVKDTAIKAPRTASEKLRLMKDDPEAYETWRASKRR